jgi:mannonate dehydratase
MKLGLSHQRFERFTDGYLAYMRQMGIDAVEVRAPVDQCTPAFMREVKERVEGAGISLFEIMMLDRYQCRQIATAGPDRDRDIDEFSEFLHNLSQAGIHNTTYCWYFGTVYKTGTATTRGCPTRLFDLAEVQNAPLALDREYTEAELWDNYEYFIERILPVAESCQVRLQLHPNDPPVDHAGVAAVFKSTQSFLRAMEIADHSPYSGVLFCVGCWSEMAGPDGKGEDIVDAIRRLGKEHIFQVHFRNCDSHLPRFMEVYPDDGYVDMPQIVRTLKEVGFEGMLVPDHVPACPEGEGGPKAGEAYILGYIRALIQSQ